jgi:glycosyltransferase involved in cell wall biosynthesis
MSSDQDILRKAADYVLTLRDPQSGGFAFARGNQPTLMATAYAIHTLEFTKELTCLSAARRDAAIQFLLRCCRPDGTFCDPLFDASQIATTQHDEAYFLHEATCFAQNALDALGAPPPRQRAFPQTLLTPAGVKKEFDSYDWIDPHLNSNRVMFWMAQFAHEVDRHGRTELLPLMDAGLDWMDAHQSPQTGLWSGPVSVSLSAAMAATFHFTFFYAFRSRPLLHLERIIDSCLELQKPDGLFSRTDCVGQTCLDYDALDLLAKATLITDHRRRDVQAAFHAARDALLGLVNPDDGFANVKHRRTAGQCLPTPGLYHTGLNICSCDNQESNVFSTWFRLLALALCDQFQWVDHKSNAFGFRRLPWLGCHDVAAIQRSYAKEKHNAPHTGRERQPDASFQSRELQAAESTPEIISRELNMSLNGVSVIVTSMDQSANRLDQFLSSFFAVNTHTPVEVIIPIETGDPGNRRDIVLKYATKAFIRPVVYTGNQPVAEVANFCAGKARFPFLFFLSDEIKYEIDILGNAFQQCDFDESTIVALNIKLDHGNKLEFEKNDVKSFARHLLELDLKLLLLCVKNEFQSLEGFTKSKESENFALPALTAHQVVTPKISVVIPVYNTEKYLRKCLDSVINQTLKDIEIIIVNDCSPDNSEVIIDEYKSKDSRIVYINHKENLGLGGARNSAIAIAKGEYLASVDSDDYILPNMLELLFKTATNSQADIVIFGFQRVNEEGNKLKSQKPKNTTLYNHNNSINIFSTTNPAFWNKLWKKSLYTENNICFPNYVYYQDLATTPRILTKAKKIVFISDILYVYTIRNSSASYTTSPKHLIDYITVFRILRNFLIENDLYYTYEANFLEAMNRSWGFHAQNVASSLLPLEEKEDYLRKFLMLKRAFLKDENIVNKMSLESLISEICNNNEKHNKNKKIIPVSIIVKTIARPHIIKRFLMSVGEYQQVKKITFSEVLVGDDSDIEYMKANQNIISDVNKIYPDINIKYFDFEHDIGVSAGRNNLVRMANEQYLLLCDDDFLFDLGCDYKDGLNILKQRNLDMLGGWLKNKYDIVTGEYEFRGCIGRHYESSRDICVLINEDKYRMPEFEDCTHLMQFFFAKKGSMLKNLWDEDLKTEEHYEFFYRLKKNNMKIGFSKNLFACHTYERPKNPKKYNEYRYDKKRWLKYVFLSISKMGKKRRTVVAYKNNSCFIWKSDPNNSIDKQEHIELIPCNTHSDKIAINRITPAFHNYFLGQNTPYLSDKEQNLLLVHHFDAIGFLPSEDSPISVCQFNLSTKKINIFAETYSCNFVNGVYPNLFSDKYEKNAISYISYDPGTKNTATNIVGISGRHIKNVKDAIVFADSKHFALVPQFQVFGSHYSYLKHFFECKINLDSVSQFYNHIEIYDINNFKKTISIKFDDLKTSKTVCSVKNHLQFFAIEKIDFNLNSNRMLVLLRVYNDSEAFYSIFAAYDIITGELLFVESGYYVTDCAWIDNDRFAICKKIKNQDNQCTDIQFFNIKNSCVKNKNIIINGFDTKIKFNEKCKFCVIDYITKNKDKFLKEICLLNIETEKKQVLGDFLSINKLYSYFDIHLPSNIS